MKKLTTAELIESTLSKLGAVRWEDDEQVLYDYPNQQVNPHIHFAFDAADLPDATQVTVTVMARGDNFKRVNGNFVDIHLTSLGVFPMEGFATFLEGLASAKPLTLMPQT